MEKIRERALKCVYSNYTDSYESLLNKARLPSLKVLETNKHRISENSKNNLKLSVTAWEFIFVISATGK